MRNVKMEKLSFPNRITVELTNACNVSCSFCNRQVIDMEIGYISDDLYYQIIDEASQHLPMKLVPFFRGESLMHPHVIDYIKYAKEKGVEPIQLASNALLLDDAMQDALIESGIDFISFSLDTTDANVYSCSRKYGDLELSSRNVESLGRKCIERRKKGLSAPVLQVSTINLPEYMDNHQEFIDKWTQFVNVVRVYEQHDEHGGLVDPNVCKKLDFLDKRRPCRKVMTDMIIYYDGRLALCNYDWDEERPIGDLSKMTMQEAWNSAEYERIRNMHLSCEMDDSICSKCQHWKIDYLDGGFMGQSYKGVE